MADQVDVGTALGALIASTLYPTTPVGEANSPVVGVPVRIELGWPSSADLEAALKAGKSHISIFPQAQERNTTRYPADWQEGAINPTTYTLANAGQAVTVGGQGPAPLVYPQNLTVFVNGLPYTVQDTAGADPAILAAAIQAAVVADVPGTTVAGATVTFPDGARIGALRLGSTGTANKAVATQEKVFMITVWTPDPATRDLIVKTIDPVLKDTPRLPLADGSVAMLFYKSSQPDDSTQRQGIWRRTLLFTAEYTTYRTETETQINVVQENFSDFQGNPLASLYG